MNLGINGQLALVMRAAHGKASALALAGEGCTLAMLDRDRASAGTAALPIDARGGRAHAVACLRHRC